MPGETVGQGEDGFPICLKCGTRFKKRKGAIQHVRLKRCSIPRKKGTRAEWREAQTSGRYRDPQLGLISISRGEDHLYHCRCCGKGLTRIDSLPDHIKLYCKWRENAHAPPTTENSGIYPSNERPHSPAHSPIKEVPTEVLCIVNAV